MKKYLNPLLICWLVLSCVRPDSTIPPVNTTDTIHLSLGNPTNALPDTNTPDNYLMILPQYALSYNRTKAHANWVSWELSSSWLGPSDRQNDFRPDPALPTGWYPVITSDYTNSGFDRGHLCPSADRTASVTDNSSTFLMTNIIPQAPELNREPWARLEDYCRILANKGYHLFIIAGAYGTGGEGSSGPASNIKNKINIPARNYKVIVAIPRNGSTTQITATTPVIAVDFPNIAGAANDKSWSTFVTTPAAIEQAAGVTFFTALTAPIRKALRTQRFDPTNTVLNDFETDHLN